MSSPNASSPTSASSPQLLAPATISAVNTALHPPLTLTHKEWIVPPRPKPGRKPAADIPPTKRKAQNRQAQRAFRERRAARVGELEDLMKKMEEEDSREQSELRLRIQHLETELDSYHQTALLWQHKIEELVANVEQQRSLREAAEAELHVLRNAQKGTTDAVALLPRSNGQQEQPVAKGPIDDSHDQDPYQDIPLGCGNCSQDTRCECIEQAFDINEITTNISDSLGKRPHSPPFSEDTKRFRPEPPEEAQANEIDFTTRFSSLKEPPKLITSASSTSIPLPADPDPCGFCEDGTPCICAEMALESMKAESRRSSANDPKAGPSPTSANPCINGPGTCDQCLVDANSTLFCKSLAATRRGYPQTQSSTAFVSRPAANEDELPPTPSSSDLEFPKSETNDNSGRHAVTGLTLSCADAYETLSRHPAFEKASDELSTWMPHLATVPGGRERTAFEVEAATVMGVLKFFDRRFGKKAEKD
ncbi:MAG: hypothetical protein Q9178_004873 [Gyalolechia marmorata]